MTRNAALPSPTRSPHEVRRSRVREAIRRRCVRVYRYVVTLGLLQGLRVSAMEWLGMHGIVGVRCGAQTFGLRLNSTDILVMYTIFVREEYRYDCAQEPEVIIDAGAYAGFSTVYFAQRFPHARIFAIEPDRSNCDLLERHAAAFPRITVLNAALWSCRTVVPIRDMGVGEWGHSLVDASDEAADSVNVETTTVDEIMRTFDLDGVDLLKVDIEGAERAVFDDCDSWVGRVGMIAIELHDRLLDGCSQSFDRATRGFAFRWARGMTVFVSRTAPPDSPPSSGHKL